MLLQGCHVYIGREVRNPLWQLDQSVWANPFYKSTDGLESCLRKYEAHVRKNLWDRLDELEGKEIGCWCPPGQCHGDVLVRLLDEKRCNDIRMTLEQHGMRIEDQYIPSIRRARGWSDHPMWLRHASRLGVSDIYYFEISEFLELSLKIKDVAPPPRWLVQTNGGARYYIVGEYFGVQPLGPFWARSEDKDQPKKALLSFASESMRAPDDDDDDDRDFVVIDEEKEEGEISDSDIEAAAIDALQHLSLGEAYTMFSKSITSVISREPALFEAAFDKAEKYLGYHRDIVKKAGSKMGVDMDDHDLSKTRLVQAALAYRWHYEGVQDNYICKLADVLIRRGHCELEDHHPEYEQSGRGPLNALKLFVDRVCVHVQKDPTDGRSGWQVDPRFIPRDLSQQWEEFRNRWGHINLYIDVKEAVNADRLWPSIDDLRSVMCCDEEAKD